MAQRDPKKKSKPSNKTSSRQTALPAQSFIIILLESIWCEGKRESKIARAIIIFRFAVDGAIIIE
jgi:hypothetical protein